MKRRTTISPGFQGEVWGLQEPKVEDGIVIGANYFYGMELR
jgi:hypothetical protein